MDTLTISLEIAAIQEKTRRLALWSFLIHAGAAVLFLVGASQPRQIEKPEFTITEITWFDEIVETEKLEIAPVQEDSVTELAVETEPIFPEADNSVALVQQRLDALRADTHSRQQITQVAGVATRSTPKTAALGVFVPSTPAPTRRLDRGLPQSAQQAAKLHKKRTSVVAAANQLPGDVVNNAPSQKEKNQQEILKEIQPGISLAGEVSQRQLLSHLVPQYPEWAKREGVEVSVRLYFTVLPGGMVKENILIERTSGYDDFDRRARSALATWQFEQLPPGSLKEQWGRIEFKYRLRDAG